MKSKLAIGLVLALVTILGVFVGSRVLAQSDNDKAEIVALNQRLLDGFSKRDIDAVMACYMDDKEAVFYEDTIPFQATGTANLRKANQYAFESVSQFHAGTDGDISVMVSGDLAVAHYTIVNNWTDKNGTHNQRSRYTQVLRKIGGKWLICHEHFSVPYDPATGKAVLEARS
jgi:ketosteroid isomerase-like protein